MGYVLLGLVIVVLLVMFLPQLKGWRTQVFAAATGVIGAVLPAVTEAVNALQGLDWRQYILAWDKKNLTVLGIMAFLAVATAILRWKTTGKVGEK